MLIELENGGGSDKIINTEEELNHFLQFFQRLVDKYPNLIGFDIINEPNMKTTANGGYITTEEMKWYSEIIKRLSALNLDAKIIPGALANSVTDFKTAISITRFFNEMYNNNAFDGVYNVSYHIYDNNSNAQQNGTFRGTLNKHNKELNDYGGFIKTNITEYGISSYTGNGISEDTQAQKVVQQTVIVNEYDVEFSNLYNFWNTGTNEDNREYNFGLVRNDYTPKLSYYAMKNYLTNTNGSEYIGTLNIQDGLEVHVYNKEGKPLIIAWSNNTNNTYSFSLNEMTAKDLYGKDITPDENNQIQITTSPVYLYNVSDNYFYQAISNMATQKYDEFTEKFTDQIGNVQGLASSIESLKQRMQNIASNTTLNETTAINLMEQHYNLGNTIMQAYQSGTLQIEYVTLSSMLDMLDSIGDSFEDLVTVSATTPNANLSETLSTITTAENKINDEEIEMVYPTKILEFSQDFYDTANYINSLEEENDIKTGLIVSKNLHSKLLAEWASKFADLYINEYIANNPVEITYSTIELTNQPVTATLQTNANITVTNNSNSKTYTFNQNGSFTFEYTIKGQAFQKTAIVNNIDKTAPTITGIQNDKLYLDSVAPQIQDDNLKEVTLSKDGNIVGDYQTNATISEDGYYKIVAIDKAGNQTQIEFYISRNPASITYSTTEWTNRNVTATITSSFEVEVINNSNNIIHTFTQNGEFKFQLRIKGTDIELTATVNNIDKTPPVITGVEQGGQYLTKTTPVITDDNLQEIKLYLNEELVNNYTSNTELSEEGFYKLIATDKAGNETIIEFTVIEDISEEYQLRNQYILNIENHTTQEEFRNNLKLVNNYQILRNGNTLAETDIIATGDILKTNGGEEYTLIVNGDVNKDGEVNIKDMVRLRKYLLERNNLDELELLAADCNLDERPISIKDLVRMRIIVLQRDAT